MTRKKDKITFLDADHALLGDHKIIIALAGEPVIQTSPTAPKPVEVGGASATIAFWGENNDFPQLVIEEAEKDPELPPLLDWKARVLQGREVIATQKVWNEAKKKFEVQEVNDDEINEFLDSIMFKRYWREACVDFTWFQNVFPDFIKSIDGEKIAYLGTHDASWCRWEVMNAKSAVDNCYVSAQWKEGVKPDNTEKVLKIPAIDPYSPDAIEKLRLATNIKRAVYNLNYPSPGKAYYPASAWTSFLFSDWFKIKKNIPIWKLKIMTEVLSASFIITIPLNYWPAVYKDWGSLSDQKRNELKKAKVKEINDQITGQAGVGKTILSEVGIDNAGKEVPMFKIEKIQTGLPDGQYGEDSQEVSQYLNRGLNVDSTLVGNGPGRGKDAGSGSDKRVAFNIYCAALSPHREVILEPLYFIAKYNKWTDRIKRLQFKVIEVDLQTLDEGSTSKETSPVTPQPE